MSASKKANFILSILPVVNMFGVQGLFAPEKNWLGEVHRGLSVIQLLCWVVVIAGVILMLTEKTKDAGDTDANAKGTGASAKGTDANAKGTDATASGLGKETETALKNANAAVAAVKKWKPTPGVIIFSVGVFVLLLLTIMSMITGISIASGGGNI